MKTSAILIFAILLLPAMSMTLQGQEIQKPQPKKVRVGLKAGLNVSDISPTDDKEFDNTSSKAGFHAGVTLDYAFNTYLYLLTGIDYTVKGVKIEIGSREMDVTAAYASLPVYAGGKLPITDDFTILAYCGPYFAYGLHGKSKYGSTEYDTFSKDIAKRFDFGIGFGAGVEWRKFCFTIGGEMGVVNMMQKNNTKAENKNFVLSVGYKF